jgi:hypothetical protein
LNSEKLGKIWKKDIEIKGKYGRKDIEIKEEK